MQYANFIQFRFGDTFLLIAIGLSNKI